MGSDTILSGDVLEAIRWIASLGAATADAVAAHLALSPASATARLALAERTGLLERRRPLHGQPALYAPTVLALRRAGAVELGRCQVRPGNALHLIACARVAAAMERRHPDHRVEGERGLRRAELGAGRALASARLGIRPDGGPRLHRPDLVLWPLGPEGLPVAVEVELTLKAPRRLVELCRAWARCRQVAGVLYCAPPDVARALHRAIGQAHAADRITVLDQESVCDAPTGPRERNVPSGS